MFILDIPIDIPNQIEIPTQIELKLSTDLAKFIAHLIHNIVYHGVGISLCFLTNWIPNKVTRK
jgi:hypothetical protein